ncbi:hypothetical protein [Paenibacillus sp. YYML68]|uniref:hypothetical protein n=1 Tax=Paenibacillus sp. YYML68 TaxID=2909250 RepID=UPI002491C0F4|nr:hypothetical protein [Paenibacillus sp. YYML68]
MFDPTIYDNLKVVLEGKLYDLDAEGGLAIVARHDRVDLATMSRTFEMMLQPRGGASRAIVALSSGMADFAAEHRMLRLAEHRPGASLSLTLELPYERAEQLDKVHAYSLRLWGEEVDIAHELTRTVQPRDVLGHAVGEVWSEACEGTTSDVSDEACESAIRDASKYTTGEAIVDKFMDAADRVTVDATVNTSGDMSKDASTDVSKAVARAGGEASAMPDGCYRIHIHFRQRLDESHMEELEQWLDIAQMYVTDVEAERY